MCRCRVQQGEVVEYDEIPWPLPLRGSDKPWLSTDYIAYLSSPEWRAFRRRALEEAGHRCSWTSCNVGVKLHVHHVTYERLGRERLSDVLVLCDYHHMVEHRRLSAERLEDARFDGWASKVFGDDYDADYAWDRYQAWVERQAS